MNQKALMHQTDYNCQLSNVFAVVVCLSLVAAA